MRRTAGTLLLCAATFFARERIARGAGPLPANRGDPIRTSDYSVDLFQGPTLASARITALGGAYIAVAEGAEGIPFNPAAASLRHPSSTTYDDWDLTAGITLASTVRGTDFDNNGDTSFNRGQEDFFFANFGGYVQHGHLAIGVMISLQSYGLTQNPILRIVQPQPTDPNSLAVPDRGTALVNVGFYKIDPVVSYGFFDDQLHIGAGMRAILLQFSGDLSDVDPARGTLGSEVEQTNIFTNWALGGQAGALWAPHAYPVRLGGAFRSPLAATEGQFGGGLKAEPNGDVIAGATYLPLRADLPWEIEAGATVQLWDRPLNIQWHDEDEIPAPDAERWRQTKKGMTEPPYKGARRLLKKQYREIPRRKVMLTSSALVSGPVEKAVGVESMLTGKLERSGETVSVTVRGGVEAEVVPYWLVLRAGSYYEPTRFRHSSPRIHGTGGFQLRLFQWDAFGIADADTVWRVSTAIDVARDYFAWSLGIGVFL